MQPERLIKVDLLPCFGPLKLLQKRQIDFAKGHVKKKGRKKQKIVSLELIWEINHHLSYAITNSGLDLVIDV